MIKEIAPSSQDFGESSTLLLKVSSRGILGSDRRAAEKRAGARFVHELDNLRDTLYDDEPLIHMLAIGATSSYGCNRNGDGFSHDVCREYHPTFVKHAKFYRDHVNKDPNNSFGIVKASFYNEPMQRIELLVGLNGSLDAARRNKGKLADRELEKLAKGDDIAVSMACYVPYDVCSYCGNRAPSRREYCEDEAAGGHCKAGGLQRNIGRLVEVDGETHQLHADNTIPRFFDISHVNRPADRIAYVTGLVKAAGNGVVSGAELAEALGVWLPKDVAMAAFPAVSEAALSTLYKLAEMEQELKYDEAVALAAHSSVIHEFPADALTKLSEFLRATADADICLSPANFIKLLSGSNDEETRCVAEKMAVYLPGAYSRLSQTQLDRVTANPYTPASVTTPAFMTWATQQKEASGFDARSLQLRASRNTVWNNVVTAYRQKTASDISSAACQLADEYALYKLAYLTECKSPLTNVAALAQNYL